MTGRRRYGTIAKDLNANRRFHSLSGQAAKLYALICSLKDDHGNYSADPIIVRTDCYKVVDSKTIDEEIVSRLIDELVGLGLILRYENGGDHFMHVVDHVGAGGGSITRYPPPSDGDVTESSPVVSPATLFKPAEVLKKGNASSGNGEHGVTSESPNGHSDVTSRSLARTFDPALPEPEPEPIPIPIPEPERRGCAKSRRPVSSSDSGLDVPGDSASALGSEGPIDTPHNRDRLGSELWELLGLPPPIVQQQLNQKGAKMRQVRSDRTDLCINIVPAILQAGEAAVIEAREFAGKCKRALTPIAAFKTRLREAGIEIPVSQ